MTSVTRDHDATVLPAAGVGARQRRLEDQALLTGMDQFAADLRVPGCLHAVFVRSPLAHATVSSIDSDHASAAPGVVAIFTAEDLDVDAVYMPIFGRLLPDGVHRRPLAGSIVRFVGDIVAVVVAETLVAAQDAAELVVVDYEPLQAVVGIDAALAEDSPLLFPELGSNVVVSVPYENGTRVTSPIEVRCRTTNPRMAVAPMEGLAAVAEPGDGDGLKLTVSTQMPHGFRDLTASILGMAPEDLHVVSPAVGGGFGGKTPAEPDYVLLAAVARYLGEPVAWTQTRSENLLTMQARGHVFDVVLEATEQGVVTSLQVEATSDLGAYPGTGIGMAMTARTLATGVYDIAHVTYDIRGVVTNTSPVGPFRGAGRPEAIHMLERAMDHLAARLDLDPVEVRRRNLISPEQFPYVNAMGQDYDSGDYERALDEALRLVDYDGLRREQQSRRENDDDMLLGIGVSMYVENSASAPDFQAEYSSVEVDDDGTVTVIAGTSAHGQGHWTTYAQIVSSTMGVPVETVRFVQSDTARVKRGAGTGGSRSAQIGGSAVRRASEEVLQQAREVAAALFEAPIADIEVVPGEGLGVRGVPEAVASWARLARAIKDDNVRPQQMAPRLFADPGFVQGGATAPFGVHVVVVEVDRSTGLVTLRRVLAVDDCGVVINPMLAEGQVHGGLAAGIGQALFETSSFDEEGNPLTTTFADYGMPSAADLPSYDTAHTTTPTTRNPLGAKGLGEAGTTGSLAATHNAVSDALAHLGLRGLDLPLTPLRVWEALQSVDDGDPG
jgi:carbon-monoxide dehydrogenase large subunit